MSIRNGAPPLCPVWGHLSTSLLMFLLALALLFRPSCEALSVRFITAYPPGTNPYDQLAFRGCTEVAQQNSSIQCFSSEVSMTLPESYLESEIRRISAQDDVVIGLGAGYAAAITLLAKSDTSKSFVSIDAPISKPLPNAIGISFAEEQAGFQAGALAGLFTRSRRVGVIGGQPLAPVRKFTNSYLTGVQHVCATCEIYVESIPDFGNTTAGQRAAVSLLEQRVDVVFSAAGAAGSAGLLEAAQRGAYVIGVDMDESQFIFRNQPAEVSAMLLSSAIKRTDLAVKEALLSIGLGKLGFNMALNSTTGGVGLVRPFVSTSTRNFSEPVSVAIRTVATADGCPAATRWTRQEILDNIQTNLASMHDNSLQIGVVPTTGYFESLIAPANRSWYDMTPFGSRMMLQPNMQGHSAAYIGDNKIVAWGGQTRFGEYPTQVMILEYDPFTWKTLIPQASSPIPNGRMFFAMGYDVVSKTMFVYGGQDDSGVLRDMWALNVPTRHWTLVPFANSPSGTGQDSHPGNRTNVAHVVIDRTMYIFGGIRPNYVVLGDLFAFNMATWTWTRVETFGPQPGTLQHATMVANGTTSLIVYGGTDARGVPSNGLFSLNLKTRTWTQHQPLTARLGSLAQLPALERVRSVWIDPRRILFTGGIGPDGSTNATYVWKLDENVWSRDAYADLPSALHSHALVTFNQAAYDHACQWEPKPQHDWDICQVQQHPLVLALSGMASRAAAYGGVLISAANPDPPPPPIGMLDEGAKLAMTVLCGLGMLLDLVGIGFLLKYWKHAVVRAAHPAYSVWVGVGGLLAHAGIVASTWEVDSRCGLQLTGFVIGSGYSLMAATLTAKSYMVYSVLLRIKQTSATFPSLIAGTVALQCGLVALWFFFDKTPLMTINVQGTLWAIRARDTNWTALSAFPTLVMVALGLYFSYKNRHVQTRYQESQYLTFTSGLIAAIFLLLVPITLLLESPLVQYILTSLLIILTAMGVQIVYFGPKVQLVLFGSSSRRGGEERMVFGRDSATTAGAMATSMMKCKICRQDFTDEGVYLGARDNLGPPILHVSTNQAAAVSDNHDAAPSNAATVGAAKTTSASPGPRAPITSVENERKP